MGREQGSGAQGRYSGRGRLREGGERSPERGADGWMGGGGGTQRERLDLGGRGGSDSGGGLPGKPAEPGGKRRGGNSGLVSRIEGKRVQKNGGHWGENGCSDSEEGERPRSKTKGRRRLGR